MKLQLKLSAKRVPISEGSPTQGFISTDHRFAMLLPFEALDFAASYCRNANRHETGGILIGYYDAALQKAIVTEITGPPYGSRAGETWFYRGTHGLFRHLKCSWKTNRHYYLGEWHYHPYGSLLPSSTDQRQMTQIAADPRYLCPEPLLMIVGLPLISNTSCSVRSFVFPRDEQWQELL